MTASSILETSRMWRRIGCLLVLSTALHAQGGIPFSFPPNSNTTIHSGLLLNFHEDGMPNFGELLPPVFGAGHQFGAGIASGGFADAMQISTTQNLYQRPHLAHLDFAAHHVWEFELNGQWMTYVTRKTPPTGANAHVYVILLPPTRNGGWDNPGSDFTEVYQERGPDLKADWVNVWLSAPRNCAAVCSMSDTAGGHPYTFTLQQATLASVLIRSGDPLARVVVFGTSYGAGVAYLAAVLAPQFFDGALCKETAFRMPQWIMDHRLLSLRERTQGGSVSAPLHTGVVLGPDLDLIASVCAQWGYSIDAIDIEQFPLNYRIPLYVVNGADDSFVPARRIAQLAESGSPPWPSNKVNISFEREAGHGDPRTDKAIFVGSPGNPPIPAKADDFLTAVVDPANQRPCPSIPMLCPPTAYPPAFPQVPHQHYPGYDDTLRYDRTPAVTPAPDPYPKLWSIEGEGGDIARQSGTAAIARVGDEDSVFYKNVEGWITRRTWVAPWGATPAHLRLDWRTFTGMDPLSVHVAGITQDEQCVLVGDVRGFHVLDAATGAVIREDVTSARSDVRAVTSGSLAGWSFPAGHYFVYTTHQTRLIIEEAWSGNQVASFEIGDVTKLAIHHEDDGKDYLYAALARGHIAKFGFGTTTPPAVLTAEMVSEGLGFQPRDFEFVESNAEGPDMTRIVAAGADYDRNLNVVLVANPASPPVPALIPKSEGSWLAVLDMDGVHVTNPVTVGGSQWVAPAPAAAVPGRPVQGPADVKGRIKLGNDHLNWIEHISPSPNPRCVLVGSGAPAHQIGHVNVDDARLTPVLQPTMGEGEHFVAGSIGGAVNIVHFRKDGGIRLEPLTTGGPGSGTDPVLGRAPTTAVDVYKDTATGRWELSVLDRDFKLRLYRVFAQGTNLAGSSIGEFPWLLVQRQPKRIVRTANAPQQASYELFDQDGEVWFDSTSPVGYFRLSRKFGGIAISANRGDEHDFLWKNFPKAEERSSGISGYVYGGSYLYTFPTGAPLADRIELVTEQSAAVTEDAAIAAMSTTDANQGVPFAIHPSISGPSHLAMVTQSGIVRVYSVATDTVISTIPLGSFDHAALGVVDVDGDEVPDIVTGALYPDAAGNTLFVIDGASMLANPTAPQVTRGFTGRVCGLRVADIDGDGAKEFLIGEQRGRFTILDSSMNPIYSVDDGFLSTGSCDSIFFIPADPIAEIEYPVVIYTHSNGIIARVIPLP